MNNLTREQEIRTAAVEAASRVVCDRTLNGADLAMTVISVAKKLESFIYSGAR